MQKLINVVPLKFFTTQTIKLPINATILQAHKADGYISELMLTILYDPTAKEEQERTFEIYKVGQPMECSPGIERIYLATIYYRATYLAVFELTNKPANYAIPTVYDERDFIAINSGNP